MKTSSHFHPLNLLFATCFLLALPVLSQSKKPVNAQPEFYYYKNTSLVYSVDPKTNGITEMFLKSENVENQLYELKGNCYRCEYYLGTVEGSLKVKGKKIVKSKNSRFTIHTLDNLMSKQNFFPGTNYLPGDNYTLAGIPARVVFNQKGKFILETN